MVAPMDLTLASKEPNCAICGAASFPECPHEGQRLELALEQAMQRWEGWKLIREWVLNHARNQIIATFRELRSLRVEAHVAALQTLPYYTLYTRFPTAPPLAPPQLAAVQAQISRANAALQQGIDADWRASCMRYPEVLDYYFALVDHTVPSERDPRIQNPQFGGGGAGSGGAVATPRKVLRERRNSGEYDGKDHRKRERRRSRDGGRTPPPHAPMVASYRR